MRMGLVAGGTIFLAMGLAGFGPVQATPEPTPVLSERLDLSLAEYATFTLDVPPGASYRVVYDHETGELTYDVLPSVDASQLPTGGAGCVFLKPGSNWKNDPIKVRLLQPCGHQFLTHGIKQSILFCAPVGSCFQDGINFDFLNFGFYFVSCLRPSLSIHDWTGGPSLDPPTCQVFLFGANPNLWRFWDSLCGGNGAGVMACINTYR